MYIVQLSPDMFEEIKKEMKKTKKETPTSGWKNTNVSIGNI